MSRWMSPDVVGVVERVAGVEQEMGGPLRGHGPEAADERLQVEPVQDLHHVVERPLPRHPEVVQVHGVGRVKGGGGLGLALEAPDEVLGVTPVVRGRDGPAG